MKKPTVGCVHHWYLEDGGLGPTALGVCIHCGGIKDFKNSEGDESRDWRERRGAPLLVGRTAKEELTPVNNADDW